MKRTASIFAASLLMGAVSMSTAFAGPSESGGGASTSGYNSIPSKVTGNVASIGFEAERTTEFGDAVGLSGRNRTLSSMTVLLSSWACETGAWNGSCQTTPGTTFT